MEIIFTDPDFIAVNKPPGVLTHPVPAHSASSPSVSDFFVSRFPEARTVGDNPALRPGIVHRLDRDTSGVILLARTQTGFAYLKKLFQERQIEKTYLAVTHGFVKEDRGVINQPIGLISGTTKRSVFGSKLVKPAITEFQVISRFESSGAPASPNGGPVSLLKVFPRTGRTHQIRVHLSSLNHPIIGDKIYGRKSDRSLPLFLHALSLSFSSVSGSGLKIEADPPAHFYELVPELERILSLN